MLHDLRCRSPVKTCAVLRSIYCTLSRKQTRMNETCMVCIPGLKGLVQGCSIRERLHKYFTCVYVLQQHKQDTESTVSTYERKHKFR